MKFISTSKKYFRGKEHKLEHIRASMFCPTTRTASIHINSEERNYEIQLNEYEARELCKDLLDWFKEYK